MSAAPDGAAWKRLTRLEAAGPSGAAEKVEGDKPKRLAVERVERLPGLVLGNDLKPEVSGVAAGSGHELFPQRDPCEGVFQGAWRRRTERSVSRAQNVSC